ncbi:MAG: hypothetical protein MUF64_33240, partial [Polyangiaceae bacterium]|nr:hypothetical protein [Polyangiaceae bacterium]
MERQLAPMLQTADSSALGSRIDVSLPGLGPAPAPLEPPSLAAPRAMPDPATSPLAEVVAERPLASTAALQRPVGMAVAPLRAPETASPLPAALSELPGFSSALAPVPAAAAPVPDGAGESSPGLAGAPSAAAPPVQGAPNAAGIAPPRPLRAGPDAGPVVGRDVATAPSAPASAPLRLDLPRGAAREIARDAPRSVLNLMPPPPERKSRLA